MRNKNNRIILFISVFFLFTIILYATNDLVKSNWINPNKKINYSTKFFFDNLDSTAKPNIEIPKQDLPHYEFPKLPVDWVKKKYGKFEMAVYHANKNYPKAKNIFIFVLGGPGDYISEMKVIADKFYENLGKNWDVIFFDQRGCGLSDFMTSGKLIDFKFLTIDQTIQDINYLVKLSRKRGAKNIVIGGGSSGAMTSLKYAITYPNSTDLLYVDGCASSADFINVSNKLTIKKISNSLYPVTIKELAN